MKTSKQKASELVDKFENSVLDSRSQDGCLLLLRKEAIECAKIAVDELMDNDCGGCRQSNKEYWQEVKNELNKMP